MSKQYVRSVSSIANINEIKADVKTLAKSVTTDGKIAVDIEDITVGGENLAIQSKQDSMISLLEGQAPAGNRAKAIPVQLMVGNAGTQHSALRGVGGDLSVYIDDMNSDVAVNSGLSTASNQTDGSAKAQAWGTDGATQRQLKTDADGHIQVDVLTAPTTTITGTVAVSSVAGTVTVDGSGVTQPVSASSLPLPSGASTSANQTTANASLSTIAGDTTSLDGKLPSQGQAVMTASVPVAIASNQSTLSVDGSGVTQPVSASALPLPSGASTSANQSTANGHLNTIAGDTTSLDGKITQGSDATLSNAQQVLVYGNNSGTLRPVKVGANGEQTMEVDHTWTTATLISLQAVADGASVQGDFDLGNGISHELTPVKFFVTNSAGVNVAVVLQVSPDNSNWYDDAGGAEVAVNNTAFSFTQEDGGAGDGHRYIRAIVTNNHGGGTSTNVAVSVGYYS